MDKFVEVVKKSSSKKSTAPTGFPDFNTFLDDLGSWKDKLSTFTSTKKFADTYAFVKAKYESKDVCYPPTELIFNAFKTTPIEDVKVVVVGQDPYHQPNQAMGLSFSVNKGITVPPSLKNIYKCIENDDNIENFKVPKHGDLTNWANQGVFLLNTVLTVTYNDANSHKKSGWLKFTDEVIKVINKECDGVVFMLWGKPAQAKEKMIDLKKHCVLKSSHPSPFSAHMGFLTCQHFSLANKYLVEKGKEPIDWNKINE